MKRLHVHVLVDNLAKSIRFYLAMFSAQPTATKPECAKWMLDHTVLRSYQKHTAGRSALLGHASHF